MRTTLTLDAEVARVLKAVVRKGRMTFKQAVNNALRAGLGLESKGSRQTEFIVKPHRGGWMPGIDPHKLNKLAAELEDEAVLAKGPRP